MSEVKVEAAQKKGCALFQNFKGDTLGSFVNKILNGTAIAIVVALIPNAVLAALLKSAAASSDFVKHYVQIIAIFQFLTPIMAGFLIGLQFKFKPMQMISVGGAAFIGSGAWKAVVATIGNADPKPIFQLAGIGDLINMMITATLAVVVIKLFGHFFGALEIILLPILVGTVVGYVGFLLLPYVSYITTGIGSLINTFTTLQPLLMSILICISFALLIVCPISTVAIGISFGITGLAAGAAAMGVATTAAFLVWGTMRKNKAGVPLAIALGSMKMMMPNFLNHPVMIIPISLSSIVTGAVVYAFNLLGTPMSSGFGLVGLVGPLASLEANPSMGVLTMLLAWIVIPFVVTFVVQFLFIKVIKLYKDDIFIFKTIA